MIFPDDANGDVLRRKVAGGDNLASPRDVDFSIVFPDQSGAEEFAQHFRDLGYKTTVEFAQVAESLAWEVLIVKHMALSYQAIVDFENELENVADRFAGRNDGWGCFSEPF